MAAEVVPSIHVNSYGSLQSIKDQKHRREQFSSSRYRRMIFPISAAEGLDDFTDHNGDDRQFPELDGIRVPQYAFSRLMSPYNF
jgi:hypothetical protein